MRQLRFRSVLAAIWWGGVSKPRLCNCTRIFIVNDKRLHLRPILSGERSWWGVGVAAELRYLDRGSFAWLWTICSSVAARRASCFLLRGARLVSVNSWCWCWRCRRMIGACWCEMRTGVSGRCAGGLRGFPMMRLRRSLLMWCGVLRRTSCRTGLRGASMCIRETRRGRLCPCLMGRLATSWLVSWNRGF